MGVQRDGDVIVLVHSDDDHFSVFGEDGAEAGFGGVFLVCSRCDGGGVGAGDAGAFAAFEVLLVEWGADDHAGLEVGFGEFDAAVGGGAEVVVG